MKIQTVSNHYYELLRIWELYGRQHETFSDFIFNLCEENIITASQWCKLRSFQLRKEKRNAPSKEKEQVYINAIKYDTSESPNEKFFKKKTKEMETEV